ncbi:MAG: divergent polysaccharide deacetylase family protein, partial [Rhodospirillales bacterium]|nr:divergent polysaccharide deacetylase family protein [Rhodospirillales bacterium]
ISLAFDPYGAGLADWVSAARQAGHEVFRGLPMEPSDCPTRDPGPRGLMTTMSPAENLGRLDFILSRLSGYVGVVTSMGSRFTLAEDQMRPLLQTLNRRGLMFVDAQTTSDTVGPRLTAELGVAAALVDLTLDENPSRSSIRRQLESLESMARETGSAVALARPYPISIAAISEWSATLKSRAIELAPASAIAGKQVTP